MPEPDVLIVDPWGTTKGAHAMLAEFNIEVLRPGADIAVRGRLDVHSAPAVRSALHHLIDDGIGDVLIHGEGLEIWDSCGLGVLVGAHRRARQAGRRVVLTGLPARELRLLRATRLIRVFAVEPASAPA